MFYRCISQVQGNIIQYNTNLNVICFDTEINPFLFSALSEKLVSCDENIQIFPNWREWLFCSLPAPAHFPHCHTSILTGNWLKLCWEPLPIAYLQSPIFTHCCAGLWVIIKETNVCSGSLAPLFVLGIFYLLVWRKIL